MNNIFESYNARTHRIGRTVCALCLVLFLGAPFLMGAVLGGMPDMSAFGRAILAVLVHPPLAWALGLAPLAFLAEAADPRRD